MAANSELLVGCVNSRSAFQALGPEWERLLAVSEVASPFLTPGWQQAWLDAYGQRHTLFVLTARRDSNLVGLWPLATVRRSAFRLLEPVGAGRSDWLDVLSTREERAHVLHAFTRYLAARARAWDLIECRDVLDGSPTLALLEAACAKSGLQMRREIRSVAPYLALTGTWESFLDSKRPKFRSNLKYYRRLAEREGKTLTITRHAWKAGDDVVNLLAAVELRSWKARAGNLKISTAQGRVFYQGFFEYFAARDQLDLWRADYDGRLIAFLVNIRFGGKCYHYNTCFDEQYGNLSPGMLLHGDAISNAFAAGLSEYDFLSGDEPYKERWSSGKRDIHHFAIHGPGLVSRAGFSLLVAARWAFRRSARMRQLRAQLLALTRTLFRGSKK